MAIINLGKVGITPRGTWSSSISNYEYLDVITYLGGSYMVKALVGNVPAATLPTNTTYFQALSEPGAGYILPTSSPTVLGGIKLGTGLVDGGGGVVNVNLVTVSNLALGTTTVTTQPITNSNGTGFTLPSATTSLAGLLSSADKTKLNNLPVITSIGSGLTLTSGVLSSSVGTVTSVSSANADISVATGTAAAVLTLNSALYGASTIVKRDGGGGITFNSFGDRVISSGQGILNYEAGTTGYGTHNFYTNGNILRFKIFTDGTVSIPALSSVSSTPTPSGVEHMMTIDGNGLVGHRVVPTFTGLTDVTSPNTDIAVSTSTTTRIVTLNSGLGANKIVKRDGTGRIPLSTNTYISGDDSGTITHTGTAQNFYSGGNLKVQISTSGLYVLSGNVQLSTTSQLTVQSLATVLTAPAYSTGLKMVVVDQSGNFTWRDIPSGGGGGGSITLTTTGTSGAATWDGTTLNIPNYTSGGSYTLPTASATVLGGIKLGVGLVDGGGGVINVVGGGGSGSVWGSISGLLSDQTDLNSALTGKLSTSGGTLTGTLNGTNIVLSGYITAAGGGGTSDIRLKDLVENQLDLSFLDSDRTIAFKWKDKENKGSSVHYGYSAQEIEDWAPELIFKDDNGTLSLNQVELLVLEVKRLKQLINEIKSK